MSSITYLIENNFLNDFLSEECVDISNEFAIFSLKENIEIGDISDFLIRLEGANISEDLRLSYLERLTRLYSESVDKYANDEIETFNEYAGDYKTNQALRELMKEFEKNLAEFYDEVIFAVTSLDNMANALRIEANKKEPDAKAAARKCQEIFKKIDEYFTLRKDKNDSYNASFNKLKAICKKFSIKYNDVTMEDKKAFDAKLSAAADKLRKNKLILCWFTRGTSEAPSKIREVNDSLENLRIDSQETTNLIVKSYIQPTYNFAYMNMSFYYGNINYIRSILGLEKEDQFLYKAINFLFKTKKKK